MKRLDKALIDRSYVQSRSQAESYVKMGVVLVNGRVVTKPSFVVSEQDVLELRSEQYVSRAGLKLASAVAKIPVDFRGKTVLDVGSSTGGFTDYALKHGAKKVIAVDVGTDQLHSSLHGDPRIELHEKTDIRDVRLESRVTSRQKPVILIDPPDIILIDVSFVSLRQILPAISRLMTRNSRLMAMMKPQFEAGKEQINKGVIKNSTIRRAIIKDFEQWLQQNSFIIHDKADSDVAGAKGNVERFYLLSVKH